MQDTLKIQDIPNGVELSIRDGITEKIEFYSEGTVHCTKSKIPFKKSLVVLKSPEKTDFSKSEEENSLILDTKKIKVKISKKDGKISFFKQDSTLLLEESDLPELEKISVKGDEGYSIKQKFSIKSDGLYGLGQNQENFMNYKNKKILLSQSNTNAISPVLVSTNNIGIFWDNYSATFFSEKDGISEFSSKMGDGVDYYVFVGDNIDKVISEYRKLTGKAVLLPRWAYGYWQSKERYKTQDELLEVAKRYRDEKIPIDCMVQDWEWWESGKWSGMEFDKTRFPDPKKMMDEVHKMNLHAIISVWPCIGLKAPMHDDFYKKGLLLEPIGWGNFRYIDIYNPEAMKLYNEYVYKNVYSQGFDGWWHDSTEPDVTNSLTKEAHLFETEKLDNNYLGSYTRYLNTYVLTMLDSVYDKWTMTDKKRRACILTRSAFAGLQRDGSITWSGDIGASWEIYRDQITAGINFCMSGLPYWSFDIGAFLIASYDGVFTYGAKDPSYMELYTRMFQFATFCPIFRSHGSDAPREMWEMGDFKPTLIQFDKLRYNLLPYIYSLAGRTYIEDYTMMRGLTMDFPKDKKVYEIKDEFMFGDNILVAPVTDYMYHTPPQIAKMVPKEVFKNGVKVKYYNDKDFKNLTKEETVDNIDIYWYSGRPDYVTDSMYSVHWEGTIVAPETGKYQFQVKSFDSRVIIFDGKKLKVELDCNEPYFEFVNLEKGKEYPIICETQNNQTGAARFRLYWKTPSDFEKEKEKVNKSKTRDVYLPEGCNWIDFWTYKEYKGGNTYTFEAPIEKIPLLIKQGSILPFGKDIQYADENPNDELEIRVYQGADGEFLLYEDEGDNLNYQNGKYSLIRFKYNESEKILKISKREGNFEGMKQERVFNITSMGKSVKSVKYLGEEMDIKL
jgi:alpha-D-xyloside xylohydrolase